MANVKDLIVNGDARIVGKLYANQSMPDGVFFLSNVSGTAAVTSSPYTSAKWYTTANDNRISSLYSGLTIALKIPVTGHWTYGTLLNINGLGDHPVVYNVNTMIGNRYSAGSTIILVYNATQTATGYANSASATTYTGCWQMEDYDSTNVYQLRDGNANIRVLSTTDGEGAPNLYRYQLCFSTSPMGTTADNWHIWGGISPYNGVNNATTNYAKALTEVSFDPFGPIYYYNSTTTVNAGSDAAASTLFQHINFDCRYSMNIQSDGTSGTTALTPYKPVFIKAKYDKESGYAVLYPNSSSSNYLERSSIVQELPITDPTIYNSRGEIDTEFIYIYLGRASSKYQIELDVNHPVYKWRNNFHTMLPFVCSSFFSEAAQYAQYAYNCNTADSAASATFDSGNNNIINTYATKDELNTAIGNINSALDAINGEVV